MRSDYQNAINIPISIKIPIKVVRFKIAAKVKEEKLKIFAFWRSLKSPLALILGLLLIVGSLPVLSAYEAHVVNVTAVILDPNLDGPLAPINNFLLASNTFSNSESNLSIDPPAGLYCSNKSIEVSLATTLADAQIIYTLDGSDPVCGSIGYVYDRSFFLSDSTTVKASTCVLSEQGAISFWNFDFSSQNCSSNPAGAQSISDSTIDSNASTTAVSDSQASSTDLQLNLSAPPIDTSTTTSENNATTSLPTLGAPQSAGGSDGNGNGGSNDGSAGLGPDDSIQTTADSAGL